MKLIACITTLLLLASCSTIPYGVFEGERVSRVDPDTYDLFVLSVDGQMDTDGRKTRVFKPGFHLLNVVSSKPGRRGELTFQPLPLTVEPCVRYWRSMMIDWATSVGSRCWRVRMSSLVATLISPVPSDS